MYDYDEVYAYLSEKHFEDMERLMIDIENNQLLGEEAFILDGLLQQVKNNQNRKKITTERMKNPTNPIRI